MNFSFPLFSVSFVKKIDINFFMIKVLNKFVLNAAITSHILFHFLPFTLCHLGSYGFSVRLAYTQQRPILHFHPFIGTFRHKIQIDQIGLMDHTEIVRHNICNLFQFSVKLDFFLEKNNIYFLVLTVKIKNIFKTKFGMAALGF